jgi:hypothetical protein
MFAFELRRLLINLIQVRVHAAATVVVLVSLVPTTRLRIYRTAVAVLRPWSHLCKYVATHRQQPNRNFNEVERHFWIQ